MAKSTSKVPPTTSFDLVNAHACGIDVGSNSNWVCVGNRTDQIREFGVFTEDHHALAKWLKKHKVETIAMESTGIYWKPLFLILQAYNFEVLLVNAAHVKNVRGKKTDMSDCHWIWRLHRSGLLHNSFQPDKFTTELRTYNRHRQNLVQGAAQQISRMHRSLVLMNLQLPLVLTDITGKSGLAIIKAILNGERDGKKLAALADFRVRASKEVIAKALTGQWQQQELFTLKQCWELYNFYWEQIQECDQQMEQLLQQQIEQTGQHDLVYEPEKKKAPYKNAPTFDLGKYSYQLCDGVDLMQVDGISYNLVMTLFAEVGVDLARDFPTPKHFASWLGLTPNKRITGGKILSSQTQKNKNRLAIAFRQSANAIGRQKEKPLANFFRSIAFRRGRKVAITATARKLAIIVYQMITKKESYRPLVVEKHLQKVRTKKVKYIQRTLKQFDISAEELFTE